MRSGILTSLLLLFLATPFPGALEAQDDTVIFLVRHAERADDAPPDPAMVEKPTMVTDPQMMATDPPLSEAGIERASLLSTLLRDANITHIHSTDYLRTRETARPTAEAVGLKISIYDASDLAAFAEELLSITGTHLVVGHSNTTPELVRALGGTAGPAIESLEYDRLYMVIPGKETTRTVLLRFGELFAGTEVTRN
jgi:phosphohistidine phosphatase SixA